MAKGKRTAAELVTRLVEIGTADLVSKLGPVGVAEDAARDAMREIAHKLCREYGGAAVYIPKDDEFTRAARNAAIWAEFDGGNHHELADRHDLTVVQVYKILKDMTEQHYRRTQPKLPGFDDLPDA
jgi:Mor family transcriptional regulator